MSDAQRDRSGGKLPPAFGGFAAAVEYMTDAAQRSVLYLDVMRQRGERIANISARSRLTYLATKWNSLSTAATSIGPSTMR